MMVHFRACAVLPAAGTGERTGMPTPKQYWNVLDRPLLSYTLEAFERVPWIERVIVTVPAGSQSYTEEIVHKFKHSKTTVVPGSHTRHRSIYNGVKVIETVCPQLPDVVIIHDGVRIFLEDDILRKVAEAAHKYGAAGAIRPLVSTVICTDEDGFLEHSLDRSCYRASEMPQAFKYDIIKTAYEKSSEYDFDYGTECLHLALQYTGTKAKLVDGPASLWKVTHKKDLYAVEGCLKEQCNYVCLVGFTNMPLADTIMENLRKKDIKVCQRSNLKDVPDEVNNVVCFHKNISAESLITMTKESLERLHHHYHGNCLNIVCNASDGESQSLFHKATELLSKESQHNICVSTVLAKDSSNTSQLSVLVTCLIFDSNSAFSGQTFHL